MKNHFEEEKNQNMELADFTGESDSTSEKGKELKEYFEYLRPLGATFSRYGVYRVEMDENAESHYFDHTTKKIGVSTKITERLNLLPKEQKWTMLHELSHLIQLFQNPESYLELFKIAEEKAKKSGDKNDEKHFNKFFNAFLDVHANSIVRKQMPRYQKGGAEENTPADIYKNKLFSEVDYTELPYSYQFLYSLLRGAMAPEESVKISAEVKKIINSPIKKFQEEYENLPSFIAKEIFNPSLTIDRVMHRLKRFLMPIFEKLLEEDKKQDRMKNVPENLGDLNIDEGITKEMAEKIAGEIKESKKPSSEKYKEGLKKHLAEWAKGKGFSEEEIKRMLEVSERTEKSVKDLEGLWENFVQKSVEISLEKSIGYKTGSSVAPERVVAEFPVLKTNPSEARIFSRSIPKIEKESFKPKRIVLVLLPDLSGSMHQDKGKIQAVQETAYSLNKSLINFYKNGRRDTADAGNEFPISVDYRMLAFGSETLEILDRSEKEEKNREKREFDENGRRIKDLDEELWKAIFEIGKTNLGGTQDAPALSTVLSALQESAVKNLEKSVYCRAIQIPGPIYGEKPEEKQEMERKFKPPEVLPPTGAFRDVWGDKWGKRLLNIDILKETVVAVLYDALVKYEQKNKNDDEIWVIIEITDGETETLNESKKLVEDLNKINLL